MGSMIQALGMFVGQTGTVLKFMCCLQVQTQISDIDISQLAIPLQNRYNLLRVGTLLLAHLGGGSPISVTT